MNPEIEIWNHIALIRKDAYFTKWVKQTGDLAHHRGFLDYLQPYLKGTMIDCGANIGTHCYHYAKYGKVICFEPNPIAFECLQHNMKGTNSILYNAAVSNEVGFINIVDQGDNYGAVYTTPGDDIPTVVIDDFLFNDITFIKIDVEGDEIAALLGAAQTIKSCKPVLCIESNPETLARKGHTVKDLVALVHELGYATETRTPLDISADILCLPR